MPHRLFRLPLFVIRFDHDVSNRDLLISTRVQVVCTPVAPEITSALVVVRPDLFVSTPDQGESASTARVSPDYGLAKSSLRNSRFADREVQSRAPAPSHETSDEQTGDQQCQQT